MSDQQSDVEGNRPSFSSFWKKNKEKTMGKEIVFVGQNDSCEFAFPFTLASP